VLAGVCEVEVTAHTYYAVVTDLYAQVCVFPTRNGTQQETPASRESCGGYKSHYTGPVLLGLCTH
jgi:hypothetical protein